MAFELIDTQIEVNEEFLSNSKLTYDIYYDGKLSFEARLTNHNAERRMVGVEDAPKVLEYKMNKPMKSFTDDEKVTILQYRGLKLSDGFYASDVFMEKSHVHLTTNIFICGSCDEFCTSYITDEENEVDLCKSCQ